MFKEFYIDKITKIIPKEFFVNRQNNGAIFRFEKSQLPKLEWVPAIQRRRLSAFAKMALDCAYRTSQHSDEVMESIFSSRHGDIHKTSKLLHNLSLQQSLSPTAFSLSVHNAVAGLFTILTTNQAATNTIAAGKNTLLMALTDGYARLVAHKVDKILMVHCDEALPEVYLPYGDEIQCDHAYAFIISKNKISKTSQLFSMDNFIYWNQTQQSYYPQALLLEQWLLQMKEKNNYG